MTPAGRPVDFDLAVPGSKSITNRALILGALAAGPVRLHGALCADDTFYMVEGLKALGFDVHGGGDGPLEIHGQAGRIPAPQAELFCGNSGTTMRFLSAFVCLGRGLFHLDGNARMRERPIADLVDGLRRLGVTATCDRSNGCPPVTVQAQGLPGGRIRLEGAHSSQYISAVLLVAPYAHAPLEIEVTGEFVSRPYVELTLRTMADFGVSTKTPEQHVYQPAHGVPYRSGDYEIEGDASAASYFFAAAAILGGRVAVTNLRADSPQGDAGFVELLGRMGCRVRRGFLAGGRGLEVSREPGTPLRPILADLRDRPDVAPTLAVCALFAEGRTTLTGLGTLRLKETDRVHALATELARLGATVKEGHDQLEIEPGRFRGAVLDTYDDHRMAMALALAGLARPGVVLRNPACVSKTYPGFFSDLARLANT